MKMENVSENLTISISVNNGIPRETLPIRAIPFVDLWRRFSPDVIPKFLTQKTFTSVNSTLTAYRISGAYMKAVQAHEWEVVSSAMETYAAQVFHRFRIKMDERGNPTHIKNVAHAAWSKGVIRLLPSATFVWWDEFVAEFEKDDRLVTYLSTRKKGENLIFDAMREHTKLEKITEGFIFGDKARTGIFDEVIETAIKQSNSIKLNPVWLELRSIILSSKPPPPPFTGKVTKKGLEYIDEYLSLKSFTKEALKMHLIRRKERQETVYVKHDKAR